MDITTRYFPTGKYHARIAACSQQVRQGMGRKSKANIVSGR